MKIVFCLREFLLNLFYILMFVLLARWIYYVSISNIYVVHVNSTLMLGTLSNKCQKQVTRNIYAE